MDKAETIIMEPYLQQIEAGNMPEFARLMDKYTEILNEMPLPKIEMACIASLLVTMYPVEFGEAINQEWKRRGFTTDLF